MSPQVKLDQVAGVANVDEHIEVGWEDVGFDEKDEHNEVGWGVDLSPRVNLGQVAKLE